MKLNLDCYKNIGSVQILRDPLRGWGSPKDHAKVLAKLKVLKKEIITIWISYQWVAQKVISS